MHVLSLVTCPSLLHARESLYFHPHPTLTHSLGATMPADTLSAARDRDYYDKFRQEILDLKPPPADQGTRLALNANSCVIKGLTDEIKKDELARLVGVLFFAKLDV